MYRGLLGLIWMASTLQNMDLQPSMRAYITRQLIMSVDMWFTFISSLSLVWKIHLSKKWGQIAVPVRKKKKSQTAKRLHGKKKMRSQLAVVVCDKKKWSQIRLVMLNPYIKAALLISKAYAMLLVINTRYISVVFILIIVLVFIGALYLSVTPNGNSKCDEDNHIVDNKADDVPSPSRRIGNNTGTGDYSILLFATAKLPYWLLCCMGHFNVDNLVVSQFLLFLTSTISELAIMMAKIRSEEVAMAFQIIRRSSLVMVLVTAHTMAVELLGGDDVLLACTPELLAVLVWFSIHFGHRGSCSALFSVVSWLRYATDIVSSLNAANFFLCIVMAIMAWVANSSYRSTEAVTDLLSRFMLAFIACSFSVILPSLCLFVLRHWPAKATAAPPLELQEATMLLSICRDMMLIAAPPYLTHILLVDVPLHLQA